MKNFINKTKFLCFGKPQKSVTFASSGDIEKDLEILKALKEEKDTKKLEGYTPGICYLSSPKPTPTQLAQNPPEHILIVTNELGTDELLEKLIYNNKKTEEKQKEVLK